MLQLSSGNAPAHLVDVNIHLFQDGATCLAKSDTQQQLRGIKKHQKTACPRRMPVTQPLPNHGQLCQFDATAPDGNGLLSCVPDIQTSHGMVDPRSGLVD